MNISENKFFLHFKHIPIGLTGIAVGIGGLGNLYTAVLQEAGVASPFAQIIQIICTALTISFLILILLRNLTHKHTFSNELTHPLLASFIPTIFMASMLVGGFFGTIGTLIDKNNVSNVCQAFKGIGAIIWYIAIIGHFLYLGLFIWKIIAKHKIKSDSLYASWFVPPVGMIVACTVYSSFAGRINWIPCPIAQAIWYFGFTMYLVTLPIISYKIIFHRAEDKNTLPSLAIYGAPANLSLTGFIVVFKDINYYPWAFKNCLILIMLFLGVATTLVIYLLLIRIFRVKFNPAYASLTFPLAIGATGVFKTSQYIQYIGKDTSTLLNNMFWLTRVLAYVELAIATIVILYVLIRYFILIAQKIKNYNLSK